MAEPTLPNAGNKILDRASILLMLAVVAGVLLGTTQLTFADDGDASQTNTIREEVLAGDTDCDGVITGLDALAILRFISSREVADCLRTSGNVLCDDAVDAADALAIVRDVGGFNVELPTGCPGLGQSIFAPPEVSFTCDDESINVNDELNCHYSAESYYGDVSLTWDLADGEPALDPAALGASCAPDGVPCWYSAWGSKTVEFQHPGLKTISLTACANGECVTKVWRLTVEAAQLATTNG